MSADYQLTTMTRGDDDIRGLAMRRGDAMRFEAAAELVVGDVLIGEGDESWLVLRVSVSAAGDYFWSEMELA